MQRKLVLLSFLSWCKNKENYLPLYTTQFRTRVIVFCFHTFHRSLHCWQRTEVINLCYHIFIISNILHMQNVWVPVCFYQGLLCHCKFFGTLFCWRRDKKTSILWNKCLRKEIFLRSCRLMFCLSIFSSSNTLANSFRNH